MVERVNGVNAKLKPQKFVVNSIYNINNATKKNTNMNSLQINKKAHQKSLSTNDEEFAFNSNDNDDLPHDFYENKLELYEELITGLKNTKFNKNYSDPKHIQSNNKESLDLNYNATNTNGESTSKKPKKTQSASLNFDNLNNNNNNNSNSNMKHNDSNLSKKSKSSKKKKLNGLDSLVTQVVIEEKDDIKNLTSIEEIKDYYEYTENCLKMVSTMEIPDEKEIEHLKIDLPPKLTKKKLAVFDLDETLIHCELKQPKNSEMIINISLPSKKIARVGLNIRPGIVPVLEEILKNYNMIIFTASDQLYADSVLSHIDPMRSYFKYRLYRQNCYKMKTENGHLYVKDLRIIRNVPLSNMIIIDNSVLSFAFQLDNGIPILPFYSNKEDIELNFLKNYLTKLSKYDNILKQNSLNFNLKQVMKDTMLSSPTSQSSPNSNSTKIDSTGEEENKKDKGSILSNQANQKSKSKDVKIEDKKKTDKKILSDYSNNKESATDNGKNSDNANTKGVIRKKSKIQNQIYETMEKVKKFK